jgi:uncharacterized membrane protein
LVRDLIIIYTIVYVVKAWCFTFYICIPLFALIAIFSKISLRALYDGHMAHFDPFTCILLFFFFFKKAVDNQLIE